MRLYDKFFIFYECINVFYNLVYIEINQFYRLLLTAILICSKFFNDLYYGNNDIAYLGGVSLEELN